MSFFSGLLNFGKSAIGFLTGNSIGATLARAAIAGFALRKLTQSQLSNQANSNENIDKGVRLQVPPASSNKIPVLYGTAHFGPIINDAELSADNQTMYYSMTLAEKTGTVRSTSSASSYTFNDVYWNDQRVVFKSDGITLDYTVDRTGAFDRSASGLVKVYFYAGDSTSGIIPENYTGTVPDAFDVMPSWTSNHKMTDLIFAIVEITYNRDKGVTGLGNFTFEVTNSMKDPGDVLYDLFSNDLYGAGIEDADIDLTGLSALTTYSQTGVNFEDETLGSGQVLDDRYQINGVLDTEEFVFTNIEKVCNSSGSWLSFDNYTGKWGVIINKSGTSVASFSDSNIIGDIAIQGTGLSELYNNVKVEFPNRDIRDRADYVNIEIPVGDRNPNELTNVLNISYELINEPVQAQLLGFIELKQSRVDLIVTFETDYSYMNLKAGEIIDVTDELAGWTNKLFRIISVTEKQDETNPLSLEILALEYDSNVYSTADLYRYTRSDDNGIITIASIGTPGTPQVTKFERDSRPRVLIESTAPSGVVEGLEYWYTTDINEPNDDARSYTLLGTKRPTGGGTFSSGSTVILDVDTLGDSEFYVKTRGFNDITTGPYSSVSGLVDFTPEQTTDAVGPNTSIGDGLGGLATAIGLLQLLQGVDGLFGGASGAGSLFDKIFGTFADETGVDLVGQASDGSLAVAAAIAAKDEGTEISSAISSINFVGSDVAAVASGNDITVYHGNLDAVLGDPATGGSASCNVSASFYPNSYYDGLLIALSGKPPTINQGWPNSGYLQITLTPSSFTPTGSPSPVSGKNIKIYKTDNTLVQTIAATSCSFSGNVANAPFSVDLGTDYYVTVDAGAFDYCGCVSNAVAKGSWTFNTYPEAKDPIPVYGGIGSVEGLTVSSASIGGGCATGTLSIGFNQNVSVGSGSILIKDSGGSTISTIDASTGTASGSSISYPAVIDLSAGTYSIVIPAGVANTILCGSVANSSSTKSVSVSGGTAISLVDVEYWENTNSVNYTPDQYVNRHTPVILIFNQSILLDTTKTATINSHQTFDLSNNLIAGVGGASSNKMVLNPTVDFTPGQTYTISLDSGAVYTCAGGKFAGGTVHTFRVDTGATFTGTPTAPVNGLASFDTDRPVTTNSTGTIDVVRTSDSSVAGSIPSTSGAITVTDIED